MTLNELNAAIIKWADDREITKHSTPYAQAFKTAEEVQELIEAGIVYKWHQSDSRLDSVKDAIGDIYVTLVVGMACSLTGKAHVTGSWDVSPHVVDSEDPVKRLQQALTPLGKYASMSKCVSSKYTDHTGWMAGVLVRVARQYGTTLEACVEQAYNAIKDRKGKLLPNGIFVKEES